MNDPHRTERFGPPLPWSDRPGPRVPRIRRARPGLRRPSALRARATAGHRPSGRRPRTNRTHPTVAAVLAARPAPAGWHAPRGSTPPPPEGPRVAALVVGCRGRGGAAGRRDWSIALIIANGAMKSSRPRSSRCPRCPSRVRHPLPTTRLRTHPSAAPAPPTVSAPGEPTETTEPGAMQPVVYSVTGEGRAISITYIDTGGMIQTEFNVSLPWSKEVSLSKSAAHPANVTIVNIGHNVTCSVTVAGVQVRQRTGVGITICDAPLLERSGLLDRDSLVARRDTNHQHRQQAGDQHQRRCPPRPARTAPNTSTKTENSHGAMNATARPVMVYRPKATPSLPWLAILQQQGPRRRLRRPDEQHPTAVHTPRRPPDRTAPAKRAPRRGSRPVTPR